jgi:hypothetical protein
LLKPLWNSRSPTERDSSSETFHQWLAEINKMRGAFGAPIPANQIDALANYLSDIANR